VVLINIGDTAKVEVDAYPDRQFIATVYQIANTATTTGLGTQEEVTNFEVRLIIHAKDVEFRPGMSCSASIETETRFDVLCVPLQSVTTREERRWASKEGETGEGEEGEDGDNPAGSETEQNAKKRDKEKKADEVIFIVRNDIARKRVVKTGISSDSYIEVTNGVEAGEQVVKGSYRAISRDLEDSTRVRVEKSRTGKRFGKE
jgi:HlyD family secretion protein